MRKNAGFTLVEFVIVLAMIGVLVMIAIPVYKSHTAKGEILKTDACEGKQQKILLDEAQGNQQKNLL